jgi:hypothetical protein
LFSYSSSAAGTGRRSRRGELELKITSRNSSFATGFLDVPILIPPPLQLDKHPTCHCLDDIFRIFVFLDARIWIDRIKKVILQTIWGYSIYEKELFGHPIITVLGIWAFS